MKSKFTKNGILWIVFGMVAHLCSAQVYVNQAATGSNDGSSWENAMTDLSAAIASLKQE